MSVIWQHLRCNDILPGFTIEETFKRYVAFSDIHDFDFDILFEAVASGVTGTNATGWTTSMLGWQLPPNFSIKYHKTDLRQGILIMDTLNADSAAIYYIVATDDNGYPTIYFGNQITHSVPVVTPQEADVEIVFRQQVLDDIQDIVWRTITVYMNNAWVTTYSDYLTGVGNNIDIGICAYGTDIREYSEIRVPELCDIAEFGTIDPGENPAGGLSRTMEGRYIKMAVRYDGSFRAWKKKQRDSVLALSSTIVNLKRSKDLNSLVTHARMMGGYVSGEFRDDSLLQKYGLRFREDNNSMLLTVQECLEEAENTIRRSEEEAFKTDFSDRFIPFLEPEDRISVNGEDLVIDSYSISGAKGKLDTEYNCREYVWA